MKKLPIIASIVIALFIVVTFYNLQYRTEQTSGEIIAKDVKYLASIFQKIHQSCHILSFDYQKNRINFLNVKDFVGSEVGPMNLKHPDKWQGPYVENNPTIQAIEYLVVSTNKGYFITPGQNVTLPNGKTIGKEIIFDENADIASMMHDPEYLLFNNRSLAARLELPGLNYWNLLMRE